MPPMLLYAALLVTIFSLIALIGSTVLFRETDEEQRVSHVLSPQQAAATVGDRTPGYGGVRSRAFNVAGFLRSRFGSAESGSLKKRLEQAGIRTRTTADVLFVAQIALPITGIVIGSFISGNKLFWIASLAVAGYMAPDMWLTRKVSQRKRKIRRSLPDAVDLLVTCVGAGLGLDQALMRVGDELAISYPELSEEFTIVNLEQRAGKPRLEAWEALAKRTQVEEFVSFTSMLTQTDRFGTPIIKSLTRYSEDLRTKRRQHAEEAAVKTKVKIIFPLVLCIFPCIFIVLLAPAILTLFTGLSTLGK